MHVIFKSAKPLSVMFFGLMLCKRYKIQRYFFVAIIVCGVIVFKLFEPKEEKDVEENDETKSSPDWESYVGIALMSVSLCSDGVLGVIQDRIRANYSPTFRQLMIGLESWSCLFLAIIVIATCEFLKVFSFIGRYPYVLWHLAALGTADAIGNLFIYTMISSFGSLACSITTTIRKLFSVIFSIIIFQNPSEPLQWIGAALVFSALFADAIWGKGKKIKKGKKPAVNNVDVENGDSVDADSEKPKLNDIIK